MVDSVFIYGASLSQIFQVLERQSNMPGFPWLAENTLNGELTAEKMEVFRGFGVPYTDEDIAGAKAAVQGKTEMQALIAYLQSLGTHLK